MNTIQLIEECFYTLRSTEKFAREMQRLTAEAKVEGEETSARESSESISVMPIPGEIVLKMGGCKTYAGLNWFELFVCIVQIQHVKI